MGLYYNSSVIFAPCIQNSIPNSLDEILPETNKTLTIIGRIVMLPDANTFAHEWIEAWNAHDLDKILDH